MNYYLKITVWETDCSESQFDKMLDAGFRNCGASGCDRSFEANVECLTASIESVRAILTPCTWEFSGGPDTQVLR
jgi:hypothetical protein